MSNLQVEKTALPGVVIVKPARFEDARGFFSETWNARAMAAAGLDYNFVQDNHSYSRDAGTIRGLHFQRPPDAQDKLVRCTRGAVFDVAVDVRSRSKTYGKWVGVDLTAENGWQLFVPKGFLHGFITRVPDTEVVYKCTDFYAPSSDGGVRWDDPYIGVDWGLNGQMPVLSDKDTKAPLLQDLPPLFVLGEDV